MLKSSLCDYNDAYILVKGTVTVNNTGTPAAPNKRTTKVIFKSCTPFTDCINEINNIDIIILNIEINNTDIIMPVYNLIKYSDNYSKYLGAYGNIVKIYQQ